MSNATLFNVKTYAPSPVWSGSIAGEVKFRPLPKREAVRLYHRARAFERQTRRPGKQDGAIGRNGLAILHSFLFDFLNFRSGRLDPGRKAIARAAAISLRSVDRGLRKLREAGVLNWVRRCAQCVDEAGRFFLAQETPTGLTLPVSGEVSVNLRRYCRRRGHGATIPARDPVSDALAERGQGASAAAIVRSLSEAEVDEDGLVGLMRAFFSRSARPA